MVEKRVMRVTHALGLLLFGLLLTAPFTTQAQPYPNRPIRVIVPYAAGGAVDIVARTLGQPLSETLKQPVIVDNRPGASANIGMELVSKAAPDGYTLLMASNGIATNMTLFPQLTFDGRRDFEPIAKIGYAPLVIVVPASSSAKSLKDLIAMAKAEPGKLTELGVVVTPGTADQFTAFIKSQTELWSGVIKSAGIQPD